MSKLIALLSGVLILGGGIVARQDQSMSFFITSTGPGNGADLGGLEGADRHCQTLAEAVGAGDREWRAYLSTIAADAQPAVHARDRIGSGPWYNAEGVMVAESVADLHSEYNNLNKETALTEKGATRIAITGPAAAREARGSVTTTAPAAARIPHPGTRPTTPAAAARRIFRVQAATDCTTVSPSVEWRVRVRAGIRREAAVRSPAS
jgi:hypothetical protein